MKKPRNESIARACLIAYFMLLLSSFLVLGDPRGWLITIGLALIPAIVLGSWNQRVLTCIFVAFTLVVAIAAVHNDRGAGSAKLRSRLVQCQSELAALKAEKEEGDHRPAIDTGE